MHVRFESSDVAGTTKGAIESFDYIDAAPGLVEHARPLYVPAGAPVAIAGWALASRAKESPRAVNVVLDLRLPFTAQCGLARTEVALKQGSEENIGYRCVIPTESLVPGGHEVRVYALGPQGGWYEAARAAFHVYADGNPGLPPHRRAVRLEVDFAGDLHRGDPGNGQPVPRGRPALIAGWTFDPVTMHGLAGVIATDERGVSWSGPCGRSRPDVAAALGASDQNLRFEIVIPTDLLERGRHTLRLAPYDAEGRCFAQTQDVVLDIAGAALRFPLTAHVRDGAPPYAATLAAARDDMEFHTRVLPGAVTPTAVTRSDELVLEGWALRSDGNGADDVYVELAPVGIDVPPLRQPALAGFRHADAVRSRVPKPPIDDAWFRCAIDTAPLRPGAWRVSLVVIDPGRRFCRRVELTTLQVSAPTFGRL